MPPAAGRITRYLRNGHRVQLIAWTLTLVVVVLAGSDIINRLRHPAFAPITLVDGVHVSDADNNGAIHPGESLFVSREICNSSSESLAGVVSSSVQTTSEPLISYTIPTLVHVYPSGCHTTAFLLPLPSAIPAGAYQLAASITVQQGSDTQTFSYISDTFQIAAVTP